MKLKELNDERDEDNQRFTQIMTRSKEMFKELYGDKESNLSSASECRETNSTTAQSASHVEK